MNPSLQQFLSAETARLGLPSWRVLESPQGARVRINGEWKISLCSNNYLGLANHPLLKEAAAKALQEYGAGTAAARSLSGSTPLHQQLEREIADFKDADAAILFNSGNTTNIGAIPALAVAGDAVFSDEINHGSIVDGCRLARAERYVYRHNDMAHLEQLLHNAAHCRKRMLVTDSVFSMDGDIAPLPDLVRLAGKHDAFLFVDEAHATGVLGKHGGGAVEHYGLEGQVDVLMGTLGKALGAVGGYIAGPQSLINYLAKTARSFLFTTSLPAPSVAAALAALRLLRKDPALIQQLWQNVARYKNALAELGFNTMGTKTPIVPILIGDDETAQRFAQLAYERGVYATKIGTPYVPAGTSRLRTIITAAHTAQDLKQSVDILAEVGRELRLI